LEFRVFDQFYPTVSFSQIKGKVSNTNSWNFTLSSSISKFFTEGRSD
jgi:hypothetical protein